MNSQVALPRKTTLRMKLKLIRLQNDLKNTIMAGTRKSAGCRRFRPGKENSSCRKQKQKVEKLEARFHAQGLDTLMTWNELMDKVCFEVGGMFAPRR